jgi:ribonuclease D
MIDVIEGDLTLDWLEAALGAKEVGCDIETSGLDKSRDRIATFQMFIPTVGTVMIRKLNEHPNRLIQVLEGKPIKIFHHAPFDLGFLIRDYPYLYPRRVADTKIAATILDPKKLIYRDSNTNKGSHSLKVLVKHHFGYEMDKSIAVSNWFAEELDPLQLVYAAKDVEYLPELLRLLLRQIKQQDKMHLVRKAFEYLPTKVILDLKIGRDVFGY